jgi:hypothetical protein
MPEMVLSRENQPTRVQARWRGVKDIRRRWRHGFRVMSGDWRRRCGRPAATRRRVPRTVPPAAPGGMLRGATAFGPSRSGHAAAAAPTPRSDRSVNKRQGRVLSCSRGPALSSRFPRRGRIGRASPPPRLLVDFRAGAAYAAGCGRPRAGGRCERGRVAGVRRRPPDSAAPAGATARPGRRRPRPGARRLRLSACACRRPGC